MNYRVKFNFNPDDIHNAFKSHFDGKKNLNVFDISDAVIIDELQPNTPEYWRYHYDRLFKIQSIIRDEVAQHGFDNQYVRDMQANAHQLIHKLKNHEAQKTNS